MFKIAKQFIKNYMLNNHKIFVKNIKNSALHTIYSNLGKVNFPNNLYFWF